MSQDDNLKMFPVPKAEQREVLLGTQLHTVNHVRAHFARVCSALKTHGEVIMWTPEEADGAAICSGALRAVINGRSDAVDAYMIDPELLAVLLLMAMRKGDWQQPRAGWTFAAWAAPDEVDRPASSPVVSAAGPQWLIAHMVEELPPIITNTTWRKPGSRKLTWREMRQFELDVWVDGVRDKLVVRQDGELLAASARVWEDSTRRALLAEMIKKLKEAIAFDTNDAEEAKDER